MKKILIFILLLITSSGFCTTTNVYADVIDSDEKKEEVLETSEPRNNNTLLNDQYLIDLDDEQTIIENINILENELLKNNTDVISELDNQIDSYLKLLKSTLTIEESKKIQELIGTLTELKTDYQLYQNNITIKGSFHLIYSPAVATAIAVFSLNGYDLAAELLAHARDNNILDSYYSPINSSRIEESTVYDDIVSGSTTSGSASFPNSGTTVDKDLYYSIHAFSYSKSSSSSAVVIMDRYDYASGASGYGITGIAVETMYLAQQAGVIVPYFLEIDFVTDITTSIPPTQTFSVSSSTRYLEKIVTLGKGEYQDFLVTFNRGGNKIIQTFGPKDAYLYLYDSNGNFITSNDDAGYSRNAWIRLEATANTQYKIRVKFYSSSKYGRIKLAITPATMGSSQPAQMTSYESIFNTSILNSWSLATWTELYGTNLHTITINETTIHTLLTGKYSSSYSYIDMYLYLIDPSSMRAYWYNDDSGGNLQAKIDAYLVSGMTYMVIMSTYSITTQSGFFSLNVTK